VADGFGGDQEIVISGRARSTLSKQGRPTPLCLCGTCPSGGVRVFVDVCVECGPSRKKR